MVAAEVVNFGACEDIALCFKQQEQTQLAGFVTRIGHHRPAVIRNREGAVGINDLEIDGHAGTNFELIAHPETSSRRAGPTLSYRVVDLRFQVRAFNRRETFGLRVDARSNRQNQRHCEYNSVEFVHSGPPLFYWKRLRLAAATARCCGAVAR